MRLSVVFEDGTIVKDGIVVSGLDLSEADPNWHALQWVGTEGWIETKVGDNLIIKEADLDKWLLKFQVATAPKPLTPEDQQQLYVDAIEGHIEVTARSKNYRDATRLTTYIASTNPQWKAEAEAFVKWRDEVWLFAYTQLGLVQSGGRPIPTVEELVSELPEIKWPGS